MIRARVFTQGTPTANGTMVIDGERVTAYAVNLIDEGIVEGVSTAEIWLRAKAKTTAPVIEWMK